MSLRGAVDRGVRSAAWRAGRALYRWARREGGNQPARNGEYWLLDRVISAADADPLVLLDVGANRGDWSARAADAIARSSRRAEIYAFEPTESTHRRLAERFQASAIVSTHPVALSSEPGESGFYVVGDLCGRNSLLPVEGAEVETVAVDTLDNFMATWGIDHVTMVKSDTEGNDLAVLEGAAAVLSGGRIDVWQFEYNHRWLANRGSLFDVFRLIQDAPYRLGKLYGNGIELYEAWHPELDRFIETNYVLIRRGSIFEHWGRAARFDSANTARPLS